MVKNPFINERCLKNNPYVKNYGCYYCKKTNPNPYTTDNIIRIKVDQFEEDE